MRNSQAGERGRRSPSIPARSHPVRGVVFHLFHTLTGRETESTDPGVLDILETVQLPG